MNLFLKKTGLLLVVFCSLLLSSCGGAIDKAIDKEWGIEPYDNPSKGSFSVKLNSKSFNLIKGGTEFEVGEISGNGDTLHYFSIGARSSDHYEINIVIYSGEDFRNLLNENIDIGEISNVGKLNSLSGYNIFWSKSGYIKFSHFSKNRIAGEFEFEGESGATGEKASVTQGKFDMYY